jgi:hypothetical protein
VRGLFVHAQDVRRAEDATLPADCDPVDAPRQGRFDFARSASYAPCERPAVASGQTIVQFPFVENH